MEKQLLQLGTSKTKKSMNQLVLWLFRFLLFISNAGDADQPQMGNRKVKAMTS